MPQGDVNMATSSIFANIKITEPPKIEAFADALEVSITDPMPSSNVPRKTVLSDPDAIRALWGKRKIKEQTKSGAGITEELKARGQMKWVGLMNNVRSAAGEMVLKELVYC